MRIGGGPGGERPQKPPTLEEIKAEHANIEVVGPGLGIDAEIAHRHRGFLLRLLREAREVLAPFAMHYHAAQTAMGDVPLMEDVSTVGSSGLIWAALCEAARVHKALRGEGDDSDSDC